MYNKTGLLAVFFGVLFFVSIEYLRQDLEKTKQELENLKLLIQTQNNEVKAIKRPLPVCAKNDINPNCRPLSADESGATIRGLRDEDSNN